MSTTPNDKQDGDPAVHSSGSLGIPPDEIKWLIWSHEHQAWWRPNSAGYCHARSEAGEYSFAEACDILYHANYGLGREPHEAIVPLLPNHD